MKAVDVMTRNVVSVKLDSSVFEAAQLMILNRISGYLGQARRCRDGRGPRAETATERRRPNWLEFFLGQGRLATEYIRDARSEIS